MWKGLDKGANKTVHDLMRKIILSFVPVDLVSHDDNPVLFIPLSFSFEKALSLVEPGGVLVFGGTLTKVIDW